MVLGASLNPDRYSHKAVIELRSKGHEVIAIGLREGQIADVNIIKELPEIIVDTITLYLNPNRQTEFYNYIISCKPKRVIFNPGTENFELIELLEREGVKCEIACTLVMLSIGNY